MDLSSEDFARAFGDALRSFLDNKPMRYAEAARRMGTERRTLNTYINDDAKGRRAKARVELLFQACVELGFEFEYLGYKIRVETLGKQARASAPQAEQLTFDFYRQFNLTEDGGLVSVHLKRGSSRVELLVSLRSAS